MRVDFDLDKQRVRHSFAHAAQTYDATAVLQRNIGRALLQRSPITGINGNVLDLGCGTGFISQLLLADRIATAEVYAVDIAYSMCAMTRSKLQGQGLKTAVCADAEALPFKPHSFDRVYSNLAIQWCLNLQPLFKDIHNMMKPGAQLCLSTFGPRTLRELKYAWQQVDSKTHINEFYAAGVLQQQVASAGFHDIVLESRDYVCFYPDVIDLMRELKAIGAHNSSSDRPRHMLGKRSLCKLTQAYDEFRVAAKIPATYEVIFVSAKVN